MTPHQSTRPSSRGARRHSSFRYLATILLTTSMVATGGFGAFPDNPVTDAMQEEIGRTIPEAILNPINSYLDQISVSTIEPQSTATLNQSLDLVGLILGDTAADSSTVLVETPLTTSTATGEPSTTHTLTVTPTLTATPTLSPTSTPTATPTVTPVCSRPSSTPATTTFFNGSGQSIEVYLVDSACSLVLYVTLGPEGSIVQETFIGQLWWFVDSSTQHLIADYVVSSPIESVDVSTGAVVVATATPVTPTVIPFVGFTVNNVDLSDDLTQFGTSITLAPGQEFYVSYDYQVFNDPCPGCITQLVTGFGTSGTQGGTCAYNGTPGISPGVSGYESVTLYAPSTPGTYSVVVEYHWEYSCADALAQYGSGGAVSPKVIGRILVQ